MMRTNGRNWTRYEISAYRDARRAGMSVSRAFTRVLMERTAHRILPPRDAWDHGSASGWRVDASELAAATTDPRTDALFGIRCDGTTGERILSRVILPDDARATITVRDDVDGDPRTDGDCYSADDVAAWQADEWRYVSVEATVTLPDGRSDTAIMGGVETGEHWGTSLEASILHTVADLISEALAGATYVRRHGVPDAPELSIDLESDRSGERRQWAPRAGERRTLRGPFIVRDRVTTDTEELYAIYYEATQTHSTASVQDIEELSELVTPASAARNVNPAAWPV